MAEVISEKEEISESDVGKVEELLGDLKEAVESANNPAEEAEKVAEVEADFSPLENESVLNRVKSLHEALMKMKNVDFWRNDGTSKYLAYFVPKKNSIFGVHLAKNRARGTLKVASKDGKKNMGDIGVKIGEGGLSIDGESLTQKELLSKIRAYIKARGWE